MSSINFTLGLDRTQWKTEIEAARRDILGLTNSAKSETSKMDGYFKNLSLGIAGYFSVNAVQGFVRELINVRGEFQKTEIAFTTMLGNADQAKSLMNDMVTLAAKTPFSLQDVSSGAKQLLAFQVPANEVVDTLTRLGNIAAGLSVPLSRINLVYGQVKAKGKLMGDDLRQFTEAGIPMVAELAKKFNKTTGEITAMVSAGKIGFNDVKDVLFSLTNEGGMFYNLMEKQSKSLSGQIANLGDAWDQMLNKIGQSNENILSGGIQGLIFLVQNYQDVIDILTYLIVTYGAYKAALIVNAAAINVAAASEAGFTAAMMVRLTATRLLTGATELLNATMLTNPIVLLTMAAVGLTFAYFKLRDTTTSVERAEKILSENRAKSTKILDDLKSKTQEYIDVLRSDYATNLQKYQMYAKLQALYPTILKNISQETFQTMELVKVNKLLAEAQDVKSKDLLIGDIEASKKKINDLKYYIENFQKGVGDRGLKFNWSLDGYRKDLQAAEIALKKQQFILNQRNEAERISNMTVQQRKVYYENEKASLQSQLFQHKQKNKYLNESQILTIKLGKSLANLSVSSLNLEIQKVNAGLNSAMAEIKNLNKPSSDKTKADWEKVKEDAQNKLNELTISEAKGKKGDLLKKEIAAADKALEAWNPIKEKKQKEERQIAEIFPKGSIKELQQRVQLIQEAIDTAVGSQVKLRKLDKYGNDKDKKGNPFFTGEVISREEAGKRIDAINAEIKKRQIKSFDEQIQETERQWNIRYQIAKQYGEEVAKAQFPDLKGNSYFDSITKQYEELNKKIESSKTNSSIVVSESDIKNAIRLKEIIDSLTGVKDPKTQFFEDLDNDLLKVSSGFEKIEILKNKIQNLTPEQKDKGYLAELKNRFDKEKQQQQNQYQEFLAAHQSFEEKRLEISKKYAELRQEIYKDSNLSQDQKQKALISSDKSESSDISEALANSLLNDPIFNQNFEKIGEYAFAQFDKIKAALLKKLEEARNAGLDENSDVVQKIIEQLKKLDEAASRNPFSQLVNDWKKFIDSLKNGENDLKGIAGKIAAGASMINESISIGLGIAQDLGIQFDESTQQVINDVQTTVAGIGDLAAGIASGNPMAIVKGIAGIVKGLAGLFNGDKKKERQIKRWANEVANLKNQYQELERAMSKALGDDRYKAQLQEIANLEQQKILLQKMIQKEEDKKKTDKGKINDWQQQISDINAQIDGLKKGIIDGILQIDAKGLADKIGDALIEGFGRGEDALQSLNKTADEVFKEMVKNALKMELEKRMQPIIDNLLKAMGYSLDSNGKPTGSFDGLTPEEREAIKAQIVAATGDYQKAMEQYADLFGSDATSSTNGLKGDIKGITEKTAGALESQINSIRMYQVESLNLAKRNQQIFIDSLRHQAEIAFNTRELKLIRQGIDDLNIKVKKL